MEIKIRKSVIINSVEQWFAVAPPKDPEKQWKNGRSAKELARFATDPSFKEFIKKILKDAGIKEQDFLCVPEAETWFELQGSEDIDLGKNGPRNHDLLMIGKTCVIGVEAKVSEGFGNNTVQQEWQKAKTANKHEKRIPGLIRFLSNNAFSDYTTTPDSIKELQYQLLTATVGTVLEAKRQKKKEAIVLVLVFTGNVDKEDNYEENCKNNEKAYDAFKKEFFVNNPTEIQEVNCRIMKYKVNIKPYYDFDK